MDPTKQQLIEISKELNLDWTCDNLSWNDLTKLSSYLKLAWTDAEEIWRNRDIDSDDWVTIHHPSTIANNNNL